MFGLGIWELVIIFIAVVIFIKPEDLPKFFRKVGKLYGELKKYNDALLVKFRTIDQQIKKPLSIISPEKEKHTSPPETGNPQVGDNNKSSVEETQNQLKEGNKP